MTDQSSNPTAVENWNFTTLKAHLEFQINSNKTIVDQEFKAIEKARAHQYAIDQDHFLRLNNEGARIQKAVDVTVSRDTWNAFVETNTKWKADVDRSLSNVVTSTVFQTYKDTLTAELAVKAAQTAILGRVMMVVAGVASLAAIANVAWNVMRP